MGPPAKASVTAVPVGVAQPLASRVRPADGAAEAADLAPDLARRPVFAGLCPGRRRSRAAPAVAAALLALAKQAPVRWRRVAVPPASGYRPARPPSPPAAASAGPGPPGPAAAEAVRPPSWPPRGRSPAFVGCGPGAARRPCPARSGCSSPAFARPGPSSPARRPSAPARACWSARPVSGPWRCSPRSVVPGPACSVREAGRPSVHTLAPRQRPKPPVAALSARSLAGAGPGPCSRAGARRSAGVSARLLRPRGGRRLSTASGPAGRGLRRSGARGLPAAVAPLPP